jgi:hypothetical protein
MMSAPLRIFAAQPLVRVVVVRDRIELSTFRFQAGRRLVPRPPGSIPRDTDYTPVASC